MLVSLLFAVTYAHAVEPKTWVWTDQYYERLRADLPKKKVRFMDQREIASEEEADGYLPPAKRDALLSRLGLDKALARRDQLDKDTLVMYVRDANDRELTKFNAKYPELTLAQLKRLRAEVRRAK